MRIPYGFELTRGGTLEVNKDEANIVSMIFDFYMAGASLGKVVDMLYAKQIPLSDWKGKMDACFSRSLSFQWQVCGCCRAGEISGCPI